MTDVPEIQVECIEPNPKVQPVPDLDWGELRWWKPGYKGGPGSDRPIHMCIFNELKHTFGVCFVRHRKREPKRTLWTWLSGPEDPVTDHYCCSYSHDKTGALAFLLGGYGSAHDKLRMTDDALYEPVEAWINGRLRSVVCVPLVLWKREPGTGRPFVRIRQNFAMKHMLQPETFKEINAWCANGCKDDLYLTAKYLPVMCGPQPLGQSHCIADRIFADALKVWETRKPARMPPDAGLSNLNRLPPPAYAQA